MEVVEDVRLTHLVNLIENDDNRLMEVGLDEIDEVSRRRGARECSTDEVTRYLFEDRIPRVVLSAVHVSVRDVEHFLPEFANGGGGDGRLPDAGGAEQKQFSARKPS